MALADSPAPSKTLADIRDVCVHHCSPYVGGRAAAPEASRTFGRYESVLTIRDVMPCCYVAMETYTDYI